jgi:hypothetical protein
MDRFATDTTVGLVPTFITMGLLYLVFMMFGVFTVRVPPTDWKPAGYVPATTQKKLVTSANVDADTAIRTPQF